VTAQVTGASHRSDEGGTGENLVLLHSGSSLPYDYLVLAAGSTYSGPIKATPSECTLAQRQAQWNEAAEQLKKASTILIIGAGAVGVELAGEILTCYKRKHVILADVAPQVLSGFHPSSVQHATEWLTKHGAELRLHCKPQEIGEKYVTFADGTTLRVDLVYMCTGGKPNIDFVKQSSSSLGLACKGPKGSLVVNDHLQVEGFTDVFCAGDMCFHPGTDEIKLGHTAEVNAHLVAANIEQMERGDRHAPLLTYPHGVVGHHTTPRIYNISLGKYDATLGFNSFVLNGGLAAILKWLIEWTKVAAVARRPIGILFWEIGDFVSNLLGRTLLPSKRKQT
jgi:NADH dehydrogenase FAD-containing subunit